MSCQPRGAARPGAVEIKAGACLPPGAQLPGGPVCPSAGVKRLESSWHGRPTLQREQERNSAPPHRRAREVVVRSGSDGGCAPASPAGGPGRCGGQQPAGPDVSSPRPRAELPLGQEPAGLPAAPSRPAQESPPRPDGQDGHPPLRLKKSLEILVRKPTSSKPKPPPRKYFKSGRDPETGLEERDSAPCPSGHASPACGQVGGVCQVGGSPAERGRP